ncbi:MAG: [FeFe] hydrogenase H-cluster maturation GTPase HydF [Armatimonadota bacterium]
MIETPRSNRLHIAIFGRRNVGKSSLINFVTGQDLAIVADVPGTTTDPVYKAIEILPLGPAVLIDTGGLDDVGELGSKRVAKAREVLRKTDIVLLVVDPRQGVSEYEREIVEAARERGLGLVGVRNKADAWDWNLPLSQDLASLDLPWVDVSCAESRGLEDLKRAIIAAAPADWDPLGVVRDVVQAGDHLMLVVSIDESMPKGRLKLPEVQTLRDALENHVLASIVRDTEFADALERFPVPDLVVAHSLVVDHVACLLPDEVPLTTTSTLFARYKGDLTTFTRGAVVLNDLRPGDRILVAEACTHCVMPTDIGRYKIPSWLTQYVGGELEHDHVNGGQFPDASELRQYKLVIHCGGCMLNRREMMYRILACDEAGVPITNYGVMLSYIHGVAERILRPFPEAHRVLVEAGAEPRVSVALDGAALA